jgi:glycosyltransferase involved in cell wall biosynthesis
MPLFSIIIPTRNRPALARQAVESVLANTYGSFEVIVADNSDPGKTFGSDPDATDYEYGASGEQWSRVRILQPTSQRLPMWANWARGASCARGQFVIMMPDKCIMSPWALDILMQYSNKYRVMTWDVPHLYNFAPNRNSLKSYQDYPYKDALAEFYKFDWTLNDIFPHGMNCMYTRFNGHEQMYYERNPDYLQGYHLVHHLQNTVRHIDDKIMYIPRSLPIASSNGAAFNTGLSMPMVNEYRSDCYNAGCPITSQFSLDTVLDDFGINRHNYPPHNYLACLYRAAFDRWRMGGGRMDHPMLKLKHLSPKSIGIFTARLLRDMGRRIV